MTRDELRLEFANANLPNIEAADWVKGDGFGGVRGTYKDEYMGFLEDKIIDILQPEPVSLANRCIVTGDGK
ncbi:hypothetical protein LCGC14_2240190 [marine sediment metagenome]|uniref:Uncharacterized protein n=1 Tax=marine sediment metagenome TaxID=412755 RepID=A0A0F9D5D5_9ZZZZ